MAALKVGGEVDAFCTKCRMTLAHIILAMVGSKIARVRCNTCGGDHAYRGAPGGKTGTQPTAPRGPRAEKVTITFEQQLQGKDLSRARKYSARDSYGLDEVIEHPTFGLGLVMAVRGDKVDVGFKGDTKTLVHGRGGGTARPEFHPANAASAAPADKPSAEAEGTSSEPTGT